jgi:hypothetical protein
LLHRPASPEVPASAVRCTPQARYCGHMFMTHGQGRYKVNVVIPLNPMEPWMVTIIGVELNESCLADTAVMTIVLFPIHNQEHPVWKQRLETVSNPEGPHFHTGMAALVEYAQHIFNLQANTARTVTQQHLHLGSLEQHIEELRHVNAILRSGTPPPSDQDHELQVMYRHLSEAEHGWHYFRQQLDAARKVLDDHIHAIIHLEHQVEP